MKKILNILLCFSIIQLSAQPTIQWQKTFGGSSYDEGRCIRQTSDGGYIFTGRTFSSDGDIFGHRGGWDFWVAKLSNTGAIQWKKSLGGSLNDIPYAVQQTSDGGYFVTGIASSNNYDVTGNHGGLNDGWVVKLSSTGAIEWQKTYGGSGRDEIWDGQQTTDHGYILAGRTNSTDGDVSLNQGKLDSWVVKISESGVLEWQKTFGGSGDDHAWSVIQVSDGGYLVTGETASTDGDVTGNHGNYDFWVLKLSATGDLEWEKAMGGEGGDFGTSAIEAPDGAYVVTGYTGSHNTGDVTGHHSSFDFWIVKLSTSGELEWQKTAGGTGPDWGEAIIPAIGGGYIVAGTTYSTDGDIEINKGREDFWLLKISETGELLWQKTYGGTKGEECYGIDYSADNGFILAGLTWSNDGDISGSGNKGENDFWILKLSPEPTSTIANPIKQVQKLSIYPNPAQESIAIEMTGAAGLASIRVFDLLGRELLHQEIVNGGTLDISGLPKGSYFVAARDEQERRLWTRLEKL